MAPGAIAHWLFCGDIAIWDARTLCFRGYAPSGRNRHPSNWVPAHFPFDAHGLACLMVRRSTSMRTHARAIIRLAHRDIQLRSARGKELLGISALFWLDRFPSTSAWMQSLDLIGITREDGAWFNHLGGRENLEAIEFIRDLNVAISESFPDNAECG